MLFRIIIKPQNAINNPTYPTRVVCTSCGTKNLGSTFKSEEIVSMTILKCLQCGENLSSQELLNKKVEARLKYHKSE